jgi:cysteine-rich repeat protein
LTGDHFAAYCGPMSPATNPSALFRRGRAAALSLLVLSLVLPTPGGAATTIRVSVDGNGVEADSHSFGPAMSADGRYVGFSSQATNLVPGGSGLDVFVHDTLTGSTERVSVQTGGGTANCCSAGPHISDDGRYVAFDSESTNLVPGDTNGPGGGGTDVFVHDRVTVATERVSVATGGAQASGPSLYSVISSDARFVAFASDAPDLVANDTNGVYDIFVRDRMLGITERVSVATGGIESDGPSFFPSISSDGRFVAFESGATNLTAGGPPHAACTPRQPACPSGVFVHDRLTTMTTRVDVATGGAVGDGASSTAAISADGTIVSFTSDSTDLVPNDTNAAFDVFVHDLQAGTTERVSIATDGTEANGATAFPSVSEDGRFVSFVALSNFPTNLVPGDTNNAADVFVRDRQMGLTERVSVATDGTQANTGGGDHAISGDGRYVVFLSLATNLVANDTNGSQDVFLRDRLALCGNGVVELFGQIEQCDDGNTDDGDCCSAACQFETAGGPCPRGTCNASGTCITPACGAGPAAGCRLAAAGSSSVQLRDDAVDTKDRLQWKWAKGAPTDVNDFEDPVGGTATYHVCVYDSSPRTQPLSEMGVPAGGICGTAPCWKATGDTGFRYRSKAATPNGLTRLRLKASPTRPSVQTIGRGANLPMPALPLTLPVTVQLVVADGMTTECWQTTYAGAAVNEASRFRASGP